MKAIPIGRDNFRNIMDENCYYVDKTKVIEELLVRKAYITLFPRPRRFGKTLMISTLDEFFNVEKKEANKDLFEGLYISKSEYSVEQGKYPVIKLNFKSLKADNWEDMFLTIQEEFRMLYNSKDYVIDALKENEKTYYNKIINKEANAREYELAIKMLSQFMERYYNEKVILLIDEYDVPIQNGYTKGFYNDVIGFIKNLFGNTLKTNDSVKFAVMTGILRVSKESIFSDLNNVDIYTTVDTQFDEYFGFNENETKQLLKEYNLELNEEVKRMYDGYVFGQQEIYNPWSILNYANRKTLQPYWINTSSDELLRQLFDKSKKEALELLNELIMGKTVEIKYNEKITFLDLKAIQAGNAKGTIGNFLLFSGYLTKADKEGVQANGYIKLRVPNNELRIVYTDILSNWIVEDAILKEDELYELTKYMIAKDTKNTERLLNKALQSMSFMDKHEDFYHGYMLGLFVNFLNREYIVKSNREAGEGRLDIMIEKVDRSLGIVVEFKFTKENEDITKKAEEGKKQIEEREYYKELELDRVENILTYSIAFKGKSCKVI